MIGGSIYIDFPRVSWIYNPRLLVLDDQRRRRRGALQSDLSSTTNKPSYSSKEHNIAIYYDIRAHLWRRLIYRDAHRTALCFPNVLGSYSNLPQPQSLPLRERDKGRTRKSKQSTERT